MSNGAARLLREAREMPISAARLLREATQVVNHGGTSAFRSTRDVDGGSASALRGMRAIDCDSGTGSHVMLVIHHCNLPEIGTPSRADRASMSQHIDAMFIDVPRGNRRRPGASH